MADENSEDEKLGQKLLEAVRKADVAAVQQCISFGVDVNKKYMIKYMYSMEPWAAADLLTAYGGPEQYPQVWDIALLLDKAGAKVDFATILCETAGNHNVDMVAKCLEHKRVDVNAPRYPREAPEDCGCFPKTPMIWAVEGSGSFPRTIDEAKQMRILQLLIDHKADPNAEGTDPDEDNLPLRCTRSPAVAQFLLEAKADIVDGLHAEIKSTVLRFQLASAQKKLAEQHAAKDKAAREAKEKAEREANEKHQREAQSAAALEQQLRAKLAAEWAAEKRAMEDRAERAAAEKRAVEEKARAAEQKAAAEKMAMEERLKRETEERKRLEASAAAASKAPVSGLTLDREVDIAVLRIDTSPMIGEGGFGRVYKCTWRGGPVAVKTLIATGTSSELDDFKREIVLVLSLRDPHLVMFKGACTAGPRLALIMEWLDGGSLAQALYPEAKEAKCKLVISQKFQIAISVCEALVYLHATDGGEGQPQILHRDLKPENVMLTRSGDAKLTDFGLSRVKQTSSRTRTRSGGTAAYMAPECYDDEAKVDEKIDIYSFGVLLNEMFGGQRPFYNLNQMQIMNKVVTKRQHPDVPAEVPSGLAQLCDDCMQYNSSERPTASAVLVRLQELREAAEAESRAPWALPPELTRDSEPLKWLVRDEGLRFAELNPTASAAQHSHVEWIRSLCPNVKVTRVVLVQNKALEDRFAGQFGALKRLCTQSWLGKGAVAAAKDPQKQTLNAQLSRRLRDSPGSGMRGLGWMFNGTSETIAWKMCTSGIVNFKALDAGYFGSGCYVTPQAEYAVRYPTDIAKTAPNARGEWALVMTWALVGNAYCITRGTDYKKPDESDFFGVPMDKQYDAHFVQVDPALEYQAIDPKRPPKQVFEELVLKNEAQLLPRYIIFFTR